MTLTKPRKGHLYQTGKRGTYQLQYDVEGKRTRISLRTSDRREAEQRRTEIMARIAYASTRGEYLEALVKMGEEAKRELGHKIVKIRPICSAFQEYKESPLRPNKANEGSLDRYRAYMQEFVDWHGTGLGLMKQISQEEAISYKNHLEITNSASTVTMKLNWFKLLWNTLQVTPNPWEGLRSTKKNDSKPWRRFTHEECVRIYEYMMFRNLHEEATLLLLGYYTGQRLQDCCLLSWDEIDRNKKVAKVTARKTRKTCYIPILPELWERIDSRHPIKIGHIVPASSVGYRSNPGRTSRRIKKIMSDIGIEDNGSKVGFHSFRKTFVSMMDEAGAPLMVTNSITGHDSGSLHERYSQTDVETARKWMEKALKPLSTLGEK